MQKQENKYNHRCQILKNTSCEMEKYATIILGKTYGYEHKTLAPS